MHPRLENLLKSVHLEEKEQAIRFRLDEQHSLKSLKAEGLALHPLIVTRKSFGYADYPEISFKLSFPPEANLFRDGAAIECFCLNEEPIKGVLLNLDGKAGEFRLFAPDFPDWIEDDAVGIKLAPDTRTTGIMKNVLTGLENNKPLFRLFELLHGDSESVHRMDKAMHVPGSFHNSSLNESQKSAVASLMACEDFFVLHGPPGTGKTTTLVEAVLHLAAREEKVLVSAPSNTAVDHLAKGLIAAGIKLLRVGNTSKADALVYPHTPEGRLKNNRDQKEIKQLRLRAEEFRRMALKYKRSYGKAEREQRNLLLKEVKNLKAEIRNLQTYQEEKLFEEARVIAGTPIGIHDAGVDHLSFSTLVIDEAGQCLEPLAWCLFPLADRIVLAGDPWQLPPTVLSREAERLGLSRSILEVAMRTGRQIHLLNTQYRMREAIAGFSNDFFYESKLITPPFLQNTGTLFALLIQPAAVTRKVMDPMEAACRMKANWI